MVLSSFAFCGWLWWYLGGLADNPSRTPGLEFVTGYWSRRRWRSTTSRVPDGVHLLRGAAEHQERVLMIGILGALVLRAIRISSGACCSSNSTGSVRVRALPVLTGVKMWAAGQEPNLATTRLKWINRH